MNRQIFRLAIPSIISNITVPLLSLVDIAIVGHIGNAVYLAAISVGAMIFNVMYWVLGFLRMGTSGMTSQALGRKDYTSVAWFFNNSLLLGLLLGSFFLVGVLPLRSISLILMQVQLDSQPLVSTYFNICIWGAPAVLGSFALNGWLVGMQNTRIPMFVAILQNIVNIFLSLTFVFLLRMDISGVAFGTMLSQWIGFLLLFFFARKQYPQHTTLRNSFVSDSSHRFQDFLSVNKDIFLRTLCLVAVNLYFTSAGSAQGTVILAVNTLIMTFFTLFSYVMDGFAFAGEALGGKFYGAADLKSLSSLHRRLLVWGGGCTIVFTIAYALMGNSLLSVLTSDSEVITYSKNYFHYALLIPVCGVLAFIYDGLFIGMTRTKDMLLSCFVGALAFFVLYFFLRNNLGNNALWIALLSYLLLRGIVLALKFQHQSKINL